MPQNATLRPFAAGLAAAAVMLFAVVPFLLAGHVHADRNAVNSHCPVCVLATAAAVVADDASISTPTSPELSNVSTEQPVFLATILPHTNASRAPPSA